jgi:hypothetical protein
MVMRSSLMIWARGHSQDTEVNLLQMCEYDEVGSRAIPA